MSSNDKDKKKEEEPSFMMRLLGKGAARKAGEELKGRESRLDKAIEKDSAPDPDPSKGRDAGELGKPWKETFRF